MDVAVSTESGSSRRKGSHRAIIASDVVLQLTALHTSQAEASLHTAGIAVFQALLTGATIVGKGMYRTTAAAHAVGLEPLLAGQTGSTRRRTH